jgi:hypothetical protein
MADDIVEEDGALAADDDTMFGAISEDALSSPELSDDQIDQLQRTALDQYEAQRDIGVEYQFDFETGRFVMRGSDVATVTEDDAIAQWAMNAIHTERFTAPVYSDQFGIEGESVMRAGIAGFGVLEDRVREALTVHDRIRDISDFTAEWVGTTVVVRFTIETTTGQVQVEGSIS